MSTLAIEPVPSAEPAACARIALTHVKTDSGRCANPFCDKQRAIKRKHGRYCSDRCRLDAYHLRRVKALLNQVGIVRFHALLERL